jgi:hypothetical protein
MGGELLGPDRDCSPDRSPALQAGSAFMELAGLEPATSWVRFKSATARDPHHERVSGHSSSRNPLGYPTLTRGFWGWDALYPQDGALVLSV